MMLRTKFGSSKTMQQIVQEAYYGKSNHLIKAEKCLEKICAKINGVDSEHGLVRMNIHESPENRELEECFEKQFGFRKMNLFWTNGSAPNAYTVAGLMLEDSISVEGQEECGEKYYDKNHRYTCNVVVIMNIVRKLQLNARETMALILHEIGHNFDNIWATQVLRVMNTIFTLGINQIAGYALKHIFIPFDQWIQDNVPLISKLNKIFSDLAYHLSPFQGDPMALRNASAVGIAMAYLGSQGEYFADSFAAKFGYGTEAANLMSKFDQPKMISGTVRSSLYSIPVLRTVLNLCDGPVFMAQALLDPHPFDENRIHQIRKELEKDLGDSRVPKEMKPQIKAQIAEIDKIYDSVNRMEGRQDEFMTVLRKSFSKNMVN